MKIIITFLALYCLYAGILFFYQRKMLYPGAVRDDSAVPLPNGAEKWWIENSFGRTEAWFLPRSANTAKNSALIFFHGNGDSIDLWPKHFDLLRSKGVSVLLVEFPGYKRSEGAPSETSIMEVARNSYDRLKEKESAVGYISAMGVSLGGGPACELTKDREIAALILQSPFTSVKAFAFRNGVLPFLVRDVYDNEAVIKNFKKPILIFHGDHDDVIPVAHSRRLIEAAPEARFVSQNCRHGDCPPNWDLYWQAIAAFLAEKQII
jgi:pimeloyl-ACP methyl ester carboxylesterase